MKVFKHVVFFLFQAMATWFETVGKAVGRLAFEKEKPISFGINKTQNPMVACELDPFTRKRKSKSFSLRYLQIIQFSFGVFWLFRFFNEYYFQGIKCTGETNLFVSSAFNISMLYMFVGVLMTNKAKSAGGKKIKRS